MSTENEGAAVPRDAEPAPETPGNGPASASGAPTADSAHRAEHAPPTPPVPPVPPTVPPAGAAEQGRTHGATDSDYPLPAPEERTAQLPPVGAGQGETVARTAQYPAAMSSAESGPGGQQPPGAHGGQPGGPGAHATPGGAHPAGGAGWPPPPPPGSGGSGGPGGGWGGWAGPPESVPPDGVSPRRRHREFIATVLAAALLSGGLGAGIAILATGGDGGSDSTTVSAPGDPEVLNRSPKSVSGIAQRALPSVVTLEAQGNQGEGGTGTGFVYDKQGHILTNNHVVASAADGGKLTATFSNGKKYDAAVVGKAQGYDVAVLKLKNAGDAKLSPLPLGDSDKKVAVGDSTIAIGAPFGLAGTVTTGIISAKNRPVASSDGASSNASYMSALQTDASINPGNSGGPLLNAQGAVIGINSAIQAAGNGLGGDGAQQSGSIGLGFAIPINQAKRVAETLIKTGKPVYPVIGVQVDIRDQGEGARIPDGGNSGAEAITPNGPAEKAGLKPGDVITKLDDTVIDSGPTLISTIWTHKPGDQVKLTYKRDGKTSTVNVTLGSREGDS
ncbi:trypsin-like peptidase domain-containing protein [Streptomyces sp. NPDC051776]|uniref:trypsin-like peptidase domain-containing protein n=1 Tax=Streptomyces sp. NPDC051776 TaxID=3155414 RepID=UPI003427C5AA